MIIICEKCIARWKEEHKDALVQANEHLDASGVADDSIVRGFVDTRLACMENPMTKWLIEEMYPEPHSIAH